MKQRDGKKWNENKATEKEEKDKRTEWLTLINRKTETENRGNYVGWKPKIKLNVIKYNKISNWRKKKTKKQEAMTQTQS